MENLSKDNLLSQRPFLTLNEVVMYLGLSKPTILSLVKEGKLKRTKIKNRVYMSKKEIDDLVLSGGIY